MIPVWIVFLIVAGGVIVTVADKVLGANQRARERELEAARQQNEMLKVRVSELEDMNRQLRLQVEWHLKMLAAGTDSARSEFDG
jgi:cell division septum initiation protein DivIVA